MIILVKGVSKVAFEAAEKRGITSAQFYRGKPLPDDTETVLQVSYSEREKIWGWFDEDLERTAPFPEGALLHYAYEASDACH